MKEKTEKKTMELDLVEQRPEEKLLARMEQGRLTLKEKFAVKKQEAKKQAQEMKKAQKVEKQEMKKAQKVEKLESLKHKFKTLLTKLSREYQISPSELSQDESLALPDAIAKKVEVPAIIQGIVGIAGAVVITDLLILLSVSQIFHYVGISLIVGFLLFIVSMFIDGPRGAPYPGKLFVDLYKYLRNPFSLKSLRYIYYYQRLRRELGVKRYLEFIQTTRN